MSKYLLDEEEQEILEAFDAGELTSVPNAKEKINKHNQIAAATFKKDKRINIRLASRDLSEIQKLALVEGIPYQTFIASILHKYAEGKYIEKQPLH